jgi:hypothetical protein
VIVLVIVDPVTVGAAVGGAVAGAFLYLEVGRYATPQVPVTYFDERREGVSFMAGLFLGIPLAVLFFLFTESLRNGGFVGFVISLVLLVVVLELGQWLVGRSVYFGSDFALPFYSLGLRAGAGALLSILVTADYLAGPGLTVLGILGVIVESIAIVALLEAGGIQSTATGPRDARRPGAVGRAVILELVGFLLLGFGPSAGDLGTLIAGVAIAGGSAGLYLSRRDDVLGQVRPPKKAAGPEGAPTGPVARQER